METVAAAADQNNPVLQHARRIYGSAVAFEQLSQMASFQRIRQAKFLRVLIAFPGRFPQRGYAL